MPKMQRFKGKGELEPAGADSRRPWWSTPFMWRLRWGAEWRIFVGERKRAKAVKRLADSQRFLEYYFASSNGRARLAVRPVFDSRTGLQIPIWSEGLPFEMLVDVRRGSYHGQRTAAVLERLTAEQVAQIDDAALLTLAGVKTHFEREARVLIGPSLDLSDPGDHVHIERMSEKRALERGLGLREFRHAKYVAGKLCGLAKDLFWEWPDESGAQHWDKLTPRIAAVRTLVELITLTRLTEDDVRAIWTVSDRKPPFRP